MTKKLDFVASLSIMAISAIAVLPVHGQENSSPVNDFIEKATDLGTEEVIITEVNNVGATTQTDEPLPANMSNSVWYTWTPTADRYVRLETEGSGCDTSLVVYDGFPVFGSKSPWPPQTVAANDNRFDRGDEETSSTVRFLAKAGSTYYLQVGGPCEKPFSLNLFPTDEPVLGLSGITYDPTSSGSINASEEPQTITVQVSVKGKLPLDSGVYYVTRPDGHVIAYTTFGPENLISGDALEGVYEFPITIPAYAPGGFYPVSTELIHWSLNEFTNTRYGFAGDTGYPAGITNYLFVNPAEKVDTQCTDIITMEVQPTVVDLSVSRDVTVFTDVWDLTGLQELSLIVTSPDGALTGSYDLFDRSRGCSAPRFRGILQQSFKLPADENDIVPEGDWTLSIFAKDCLGNACLYSGAELPVSILRVGSASNPFGDLDGDGVVNLLENAFGLDQLTSDNRILNIQAGTPGLPLIIPQPQQDGVNFSVSYIRTEGFVYTIQYSTDNLDWQDYLGLEENIEAFGSGPLQLVSVQTPLVKEPRFFVRVRVDAAP